KVDRKALPPPGVSDPTPAETTSATLTRAEQTLASIWAEALRLPEVRVTDNFFELGGDSILSIQIVARANRAGLRLTPRLLFDYQTVAELAAAVEKEEVTAVGGTTAEAATAAAEAESETVEREAPLTPIQRWFFEQDFDKPHHWNQSLLLKTR